MSKFKTNLARRDPEKVARLRAVLDPLFDASLVELNTLVNEPIPEEVIQLKDPRAGEKFVDAHRRKMSATAARKRVISEHLSLVERLIDLTGLDVKAEQDETTEAQENERNLLIKMLDQLKRGTPERAKELEEETGGEFDFGPATNRR